MKFRGIVVHGRSGAENAYPFEGPDDLMTRSPVKVMRYFMEHVAEHKFIEHQDYEIFSALRSDDRSVVTVLGEFHYSPDSKSPFMCMISAM
jgi:hypothetical protein